MAKRGNVAVNAAVRACVDHGGRAHGLHVPAKEAGKEGRALGAVARRQGQGK